MKLEASINETAIETTMEACGVDRRRVIAIYRGSLADGTRITLRSTGSPWVAGCEMGELSRVERGKLLGALRET